MGLDFMAKWKNVLGGRIKSFEKKTDTAVQAEQGEISANGNQYRRNAIIGLRIVPLSVPVSNDSVITCRYLSFVTGSLNPICSGMHKKKSVVPFRGNETYILYC